MGGICCIDEFDKMNEQDRTSIHEAMEQQTISITKAGICATLSARCSVIAAANPREGRYNPQHTFAENVDLSDPILSRFDLLCVLRDIPDANKDDLLADFVICSHRKSHIRATDEMKKTLKPRTYGYSSTVQPLNQQTLVQYIQYARAKCHPAVSEDDREKIARFYQEIRSHSKTLPGGAKMTVRHVESVVRLTEAHARMELRNKVEKRDVDHAIAIMLESYCQTLKVVDAKAVRWKFGHYISQVQDHVEELHQVLSRVMSKKEIEQPRRMNAGFGLQAGGAGIFGGFGGERVWVKKKDFVAESKLFMLQDSVDSYLKSDLFVSGFVFEEDAREGAGGGRIRRRDEDDE